MRSRRPSRNLSDTSVRETSSRFFKNFRRTTTHPDERTDGEAGLPDRYAPAGRADRYAAAVQSRAVKLEIPYTCVRRARRRRRLRRLRTSSRRSRTQTTAKPRATPKPTRPSPPPRTRVSPASLRNGRLRPGAACARRWYPSKFRRPTHLARRVAKLNRRRGPSCRWAPGAQNTQSESMTTPATVSQVTGSRRQNIPAAAGHRRRARRSPGRSPGTTDFASRPGFPHDLGWGPL